MRCCGGFGFELMHPEVCFCLTILYFILSCFQVALTAILFFSLLIKQFFSNDIFTGIKIQKINSLCKHLYWKLDFLIGFKISREMYHARIVSDKLGYMNLFYFKAGYILVLLAG